MTRVNGICGLVKPIEQCSQRKRANEQPHEDVGGAGWKTAWQGRPDRGNMARAERLQTVLAAAPHVAIVGGAYRANMSDFCFYMLVRRLAQQERQADQGAVLSFDNAFQNH